MGKKRKKKIFETQAEYEAWERRTEESITRLRDRAAMIKAELDAWRQQEGGKPA